MKPQSSCFFFPLSFSLVRFLFFFSTFLSLSNPRIKEIAFTTSQISLVLEFFVPREKNWFIFYPSQMFWDHWIFLFLLQYWERNYCLVKYFVMHYRLLESYVCSLFFRRTWPLMVYLRENIRQMMRILISPISTYQSNFRYMHDSFHNNFFFFFCLFFCMIRVIVLSL